MFTRREVVTGGVLGTLSTAAPPAGAGQGATDAVALANGFQNIQRVLIDIKTVLDDSLRQPGLGSGYIRPLRGAFDVFMRANGRFPAYCEVGTAVFYDAYDWHVRHAQPIQIARMADNRIAIQFMFTQLILRWENDASFIGVPFDR